MRWKYEIQLWYIYKYLLFSLDERTDMYFILSLAHMRGWWVKHDIAYLLQES